MSKSTKEFVSANLIAIYYHELGHALIDILKLPIYGQEEDAADVLSAVLIDEFFDEETAQQIAIATAGGFLGEKSITEAQRANVAYWDVHGPDLQRYYTFVCLFYGANRDKRLRMAVRLGLPEERRSTCREEFGQAQNAWGAVISKLMANGAGSSIRTLVDHRVGEFGILTAKVIGAEVRDMNARLSLPKRLLVRVEACDEINAFYDAKRREIIMCIEFARYLADVHDN